MRIEHIRRDLGEALCCHRLPYKAIPHEAVNLMLTEPKVLQASALAVTLKPLLPSVEQGAFELADPLQVALLEQPTRRPGLAHDAAHWATREAVTAAKPAETMNAASQSV